MAPSLVLALFFAANASPVPATANAAAGASDPATAPSPSATTPNAASNAPPDTATSPRPDAQPNPPPDSAPSASALAEQRRREGDAALNRGDIEAARLAFVQAFALDAAPRYLWSLAIAEAKGTHPIEALGHFRRYLRFPSATDADRREAAVWMAAATARTGHIRVETAPGTTITLDMAVNAGTTPLADPIDVSPGPHRLTATRGAQTATTTIDPRAGETVVWQLQWESVAGSATAGARGEAADASAARRAEGLTPNGKPLPSAQWIVAASLVGGGLVTFAVAGGVTAAGTNEAAKESQLSAQTGVCPQPPMTTACAALKNAADAHATDGNVALGFVGAGGALVVAGVLALVAWPTAKPRTTGFVAPVLARAFGGAQWIQPF